MYIAENQQVASCPFLARNVYHLRVLYVCAASLFNPGQLTFWQLFCSLRSTPRASPQDVGSELSSQLFDP